MPKIEFRGKTYNNEFEMPFDIRQAYNAEMERSNQKSDTSGKYLTDIVEMSPQLKEIYERAQGKVEERTVSSRPLNELPKTEDIYRQSAPECACKGCQVEGTSGRIVRDQPNQTTRGSKWNITLKR